MKPTSAQPPLQNFLASSRVREEASQLVEFPLSTAVIVMVEDSVNRYRIPDLGRVFDFHGTGVINWMRTVMSI